MLTTAKHAELVIEDADRVVKGELYFSPDFDRLVQLPLADSSPRRHRIYKNSNLRMFFQYGSGGYNMEEIFCIDSEVVRQNNLEHVLPWCEFLIEDAPVEEGDAGDNFDIPAAMLPLPNGIDRLLDRVREARARVRLGRGGGR